MKQRDPMHNVPARHPDRMAWWSVVWLGILLAGVWPSRAEEGSRLQAPQPQTNAMRDTGTAATAKVLPAVIPANVLAVAPGQAAAALTEKAVADQAAAPAAAAPAAAPAPPPPAAEAKAAVPAAAAKEPEPATAEKAAKPLLAAPKSDIQITSDTMDMNLANHTTTFVGHVEVSDGTMRLTADRMTVLFGEDNKPQTIEATGNVLILQPDVKRKAKAGRAHYAVVTGVVTLTENPVLTEDRHALSGADKIIYNRDTQNAKTEGGKPVIVIVPDNDDAFKDLNILGGARKKDGN